MFIIKGIPKQDTIDQGLLLCQNDNLSHNDVLKNMIEIKTKADSDLIRFYIILNNFKKTKCKIKKICIN